MLRRFPQPRIAITIFFLAMAGLPQVAASQPMAVPQRAPVNARPLVAAEAPYTAPSVAAAEATGKQTIRVGLLLPLTGRNAALGRMLQDAATIALFDKYAQLSQLQQAIRVELLPKDTGDAPELARNAAQQAIAEGAQLLIGPIFSDSTAAVAAVAAAHHVPMLSFSNNRARATPGTYLLGFSPQEQAYRVVSYALQHQRQRVAVMVPSSALGNEVLAGARQAATDAGVELASEQQYPSHAIGIEGALSKLTAEGAPPFDSLLLAEGDTALATLLRALSARGVTPASVQFLGTGIWDDPTLLRQVNLTGAWFASSPPALTAQFTKRFEATYHYTPSRIASLAYDAVALAVTLAVSERPYTPETLTNIGGFMGPANGIFRLRSDSLTERGLAVIGINGTQLQVLAPAPESFGK